jgi:hypothetical protein
MAKGRHRVQYHKLGPMLKTLPLIFVLSEELVLQNSRSRPSHMTDGQIRVNCYHLEAANYSRLVGFLGLALNESNSIMRSTTRLHF